MVHSQQLSIHFPGKLVFANGVLPQLATDIIALHPTKILLVTIEPLIEKLQVFINQMHQENISVIIHTGINQEPSFQDFISLMEFVAPQNPDIIIGIGGGSVLDIAKLVAAQLGNEQQLKDYVGIGLLKGRAKKLVCIPTTAGTGSEVSPNAILVDNYDNQKKGIISPYLLPDMVYVDPTLTLSVPPAITAATGLDALTHCLEAYTNKFAHPFIDMYAIEGIRLIAANIVAAVKDGNNLEARSNIAMGSLLGGFCLGPVNTAGVHALSYPLGSMFHLSHGLSNALLLPYVMQYNLQADPQKYAQVAIALGCEKGATDLITAELGVEKVKELIANCGIPARLHELGVTKSSIPEMAAAAMKIQRLLKNNPRLIEEKDAIAIFESAF